MRSNFFIKLFFCFKQLKENFHPNRKKIFILFLCVVVNTLCMNFKTKPMFESDLSFICEIVSWEQSKWKRIVRADLIRFYHFTLSLGWLKEKNSLQRNTTNEWAHSTAASMYIICGARVWVAATRENRVWLKESKWKLFCSRIY